MDDITRELDARGLQSPVPILRARKCLSTMRIGETMKIVADDPSSLRDFPALAKVMNVDLLSAAEVDAERGKEFVFVLKKMN